MKAICWGILISIGAIAVAFTAELRASGPIAVYAIVERAVLEPNDAAPDRIQVWGVFMLETEALSSSYTSPQRGYLYYKISTDKDAKATRTVWSDLKKVAATGTTIGFGGGGSTGGAGRVRRATETPDIPDAFPLGNGVFPMNDFVPIVSQLKEALKTR